MQGFRKWAICPGFLTTFFLSEHASKSWCSCFLRALPSNMKRDWLANHFCLQGFVCWVPCWWTGETKTCWAYFQGTTSSIELRAFSCSCTCLACSLILARRVLLSRGRQKEAPGPNARHRCMIQHWALSGKRKHEKSKSKPRLCQWRDEMAQDPLGWTGKGAN